MNKQKIKIGILSTANIGKRSVIPSIFEITDKFELKGIASRELTKAEALSQIFQCKAFGNYDEILDNEFIDAVYIPLPNSMHYEWVKKALSRGIHVLVEKSLGSSLKEVTELNILAEINGLALIENFQFRFHRQFKVIKEIISSGMIGSVNYIRSSFEFPPFSEKSDIRYQKKLGGGALLDAGAYPIKISQLLLGLELSVKAAHLKNSDEFGVNIGGGAFLQQNNGIEFSEISFGFDNYYQCSVEVFGTQGKISTDRIFTAPPMYVPKIFLETQGNPIRTIEVEMDNHFVNMLHHFYDSVFNAELREEEYIQNINQARLLEEVNNLSYGK